MRNRESTGVRPGESPLPIPESDDSILTGMIGAKGYHDDMPLCQFASWAAQAGLFELLAGARRTTLHQVVAATPFSEPGAEAVIGVLASLKLIVRDSEGLGLSPVCREYLTTESPFYMGDSLFLTCKSRIPASFVKPGALPGSLRREVAIWPGWLGTAIKRLRGWSFGGDRMLRNQHSRNLPATVAAANLSLFRDARVIVDMAGGSGTFAIPFAQLHPDRRLILADLPRALAGARRFLRLYGLGEQVELIGMDVFAAPWPIPECDLVFLGNFIHGFEDDRCVKLLRLARERLEPGGRVVLHELVWNDNKDGPLKTALFNVTMRKYGGRQRTRSELDSLLERAGFVARFVVPTAGGFVAAGGATPT